MEDVDRLLRKFERLHEAVEAELAAQEQRAAGRSDRATSRERLQEDLTLHEEALAIATERRRDLDNRWQRALDQTDLEELERLDAHIAELVREVALLEADSRRIRNQLSAMPPATG